MFDYVLKTYSSWKIKPPVSSVYSLVVKVPKLSFYFAFWREIWLHSSLFVPQLLTEGHVLLALFSYVRGNEAVSQPQEWSPAQFEEIQLHAMGALCTVAPLCVQDYMTCQGNTRLLLLLEWCVGKGMLWPPFSCPCPACVASLRWLFFQFSLHSILPYFGLWMMC